MGVGGELGTVGVGGMHLRVGHAMHLHASGMAMAGPMPITSGGTPTTWNPRKMAKMGRPFFWANARDAISTHAAPSDTCIL